MQTQTHDLTFTDTEVRKRFVSWDRGEAEREWACLSVLAEHAPGVAPRPLRREIVDGAPVVVMERLPGEPLGGRAADRRPDRLAGGGAVAACTTSRSPRRAPPGSASAATAPAARGRRSRSGWATTYDLAACQDPALVADAVAAALAWLATPGACPEPRLSAPRDRRPQPGQRALGRGAVPARRLRGRRAQRPGVRARRPRRAPRRPADRASTTRRPWSTRSASTRPPGERLTAYRPLWAAFWLAMLLPGNGGWRRNPPGTTEAQARHLLGLLDALRGPQGRSGRQQGVGAVRELVGGGERVVDHALGGALGHGLDVGQRLVQRRDAGRRQGRQRGGTGTGTLTGDVVVGVLVGCWVGAASASASGWASWSAAWWAASSAWRSGCRRRRRGCPAGRALAAVALGPAPGPRAGRGGGEDAGRGGAGRHRR